MKFFKQSVKNSCNIIAIQHVLSFFDIYTDFSEIKQKLPNHSFGNLLPEIGLYLESCGLKTKILSNSERFSSKSNLLSKTVNEYKEKGSFESKIPSESDIKNKPIIVNIDSCKISHKKGGPIPHYVVLLKEDKDLYLYDGSNFNEKTKTTFSEIYQASLNINKLQENGMWLFLT